MHRTRTAILGLLLVCGCTLPTSSHVDGPLEVRARSASLQLTNHTSEPVYWFAVERSTAALIDWFPCSDPSHCEGIAPGETYVLPYAQLEGYSPQAKEAIVYWWHLSARPEGGFRMDSIRSIIVDLDTPWLAPD